MLRRMRDRGRRRLADVFARAEVFLVRRSEGPRYPPVFIIGPARSGSTLVYQGFARGLRVSYLSNLMARYQRFPALVGLVTSPFGGCSPKTTFQSQYGKIEGRNAPNQGIAVWNRWFPRQGDVTAPVELTAETRGQIRGLVAAIERAYRAPFINKWQGHNAHLRLLCDVFPEALFVRIHRDPLQTACSVYRGRLEMGGDLNKSFTRVTRTYSRFAGSDPITQVCGYVIALERDLDDDAVTIGADRFFNLSYEEFCQQPSRQLSEFRAWYHSRTGHDIPLRAALPKSFEISSGRPTDGEIGSQIQERMEQVVEMLYPDGHPHFKQAHAESHHVR